MRRPSDRKELRMTRQTDEHAGRTRDQQLRDRARDVIANGMYGHQSVASLPDGFPQFFARGEGSRLWDVDGKEYIDLMCSYGPIVLGHCHPAVDRAAAERQGNGDCFNGPTEAMVELAELLVGITPFADWAWFAKNGTDATVYALSLARAHTGKRYVLRAKGAYHGAAPVWMKGNAGTLPEDHAYQLDYEYNDLDSVRAAVELAGDDLAAVIVSAFRHDVFRDQELPTHEFAQGLRDLCDATGAVLILDDVRAGFRLDLGGSWERVGVRPDLSAYCKAIANGYPISAVLGRAELQEATGRVFDTGSYWFQAAPMAAAIATITQLQEIDGIGRMERAGNLLRKGLAEQSASHGVPVTQSGPPQLPFVTFAGDNGAAFDTPRARLFSSEAVKRGVYLHPYHNGFLSAAHTEADINQILEVTDVAFSAVRREFHGE
jgi:glutamate-1-semialdehyde 2,1-aminomutase